VAIRVVLADGMFLFREALTRILADAPGIEVVGVAARLDELVSAIDLTGPDVVLSEARLPPTHTDEGILVAGGLRDSHPDTGVVILGADAEPDLLAGLLEPGSGGRAYLLKDGVERASHLLGAINAVHAGQSFVDPRQVAALARDRARVDGSALSELTTRQLQTLACIAQGMSNDAIAHELSLTTRAVEKHINAIFLKLNLAHAPQLSQRVMAALIYLDDAHRTGVDSRPRRQLARVG
jgi:DNA-binding NarL/FixJ family response regulator